MLIQFEKSTRAAYGGNVRPLAPHMRDGASRNPAIQLRASCQSEAFHPVASSRVEETTTHPFIQFLRDIAPVLAAALFFAAFGVVAAVIKALAFGA